MSDKTEPFRETELDPIEWAIVAIIISGSSLALSLEKKLKDASKDKKEAVQKKAVSGNVLRLSRIRKHLEEMRGFLGSMTILGELVDNPTSAGITRGEIHFRSKENEEEFNSKFDSVLHAVSRINRLISEIDPDGIPSLTETDKADFIDRPIDEIKQRTVGCLSQDIPPRTRIKLATELLSDYQKYIEDLEKLISR